MTSKINFSSKLLILLCLYPFVASAADNSNQIYLQQQNIPIPQTIRDPFTPSELMFNIASTTSGSNINGFTPGQIGSTVPRMRLRGFIDRDEDNPIALLEVAGARTYLVREGDEINIDSTNPLNVIRVTNITRLSITVETGRLGAIRVQR